jgi:hypothetical protein
MQQTKPSGGAQARRRKADRLAVPETMLKSSRPLLAGAALAISVTTAFAACEKSKPEESQAGGAALVGAEQSVYPLGSLGSARDYSLKVLAVQDCQVEPHFAPPTGVRKLGVEVEVSGLSTRDVPVNPFYARVVAPSGERYESTLAGCRPALRAGRVHDGERVRGWLTFDVPVGIDRLELSYEPVVLGVGREELRFDLGG